MYAPVDSEALVRAYDIFSFSIRAACGCLLPGVVLLRSKSYNPVIAQLITMYATIFSVHGLGLLLLRKYSRQYCSILRTLLVVFVRVVSLLLCLQITIRLSDSPPTPSSLLLHLSLTTGSYHLAWHAICIPLSFPLQAILQVVLVIYTMTQQAMPICTQIELNPDAADVVKAMWVKLEQIHSLVSGMYQLRIPPPTMFTIMCIPITAYLQLMLAVVVPLLVHYIMQYQYFLWQLRQQNAQQRQGHIMRQWCPFAWVYRLQAHAPMWHVCVTGALLAVQLASAYWQVVNTVALTLLDKNGQQSTSKLGS